MYSSVFDSVSKIHKVYQKDQEIVEDMNLIISGQFDSIIDFMAGEIVANLLKDSYHSEVHQSPFGNIYFVGRVYKNNTGKSVFRIGRNGLDRSMIFNLPGRFREKEFRSILANRKGPFTKKTVDGILIDCDPWYSYEVCVVGGFFECVESYVLAIMSDFLLNVCLAPLEVVPKNLADLPVLKAERNKIFNMIDSECLKKKIRLCYDREHQKMDELSLMEDNEIDEDIDYGEDEIRSMDEETNGHWRWNID